MFIRDVSRLSDDENLNLSAYTGYDVKDRRFIKYKNKKEGNAFICFKNKFLKECINFEIRTTDKI